MSQEVDERQTSNNKAMEENKCEFIDLESSEDLHPEQDLPSHNRKFVEENQSKKP